MNCTEQLKQNCENIAKDFEAYGADYLVADRDSLFDEAKYLQDEALSMEAAENKEEAKEFRANAKEIEEKAENVIGLDGCYDIEYRVDQAQLLNSVKLMLAGGGPTIYLEVTAFDATVKGSWGVDKIEVRANVDKSELCEVLDYFEEIKGF